MKKRKKKKIKEVLIVALACAILANKTYTFNLLNIVLMLLAYPEYSYTVSESKMDLISEPLHQTKIDLGPYLLHCVMSHDVI